LVKVEKKAPANFSRDAKMLWVYISRHRFTLPSDYLSVYHNTLRGIKELCGQLDIDGVLLAPHGFRRFYVDGMMKPGVLIFFYGGQERC